MGHNQLEGEIEVNGFYGEQLDTEVLEEMYARGFEPTSFLPDDDEWHSVKAFWGNDGSEAVFVDGEFVEGDPDYAAYLEMEGVV